MPTYQNFVKLAPDARAGTLSQVRLTLSNPNVHTVAIPSTCRGVRLTTTASNIVFAVDENPVARGAVAGGNVVASGDLTVGHTLSSTEREVRLLDKDALQLRLIGAAASVIDIEFFA